MFLVAAEIEEMMDTMEDKITWQDIAVAAELTKGALSHFKNKGQELSFLALLKIAKFVYSGDYIVRFKNWCLQFSKPKNIYLAFEYLAVNRQTTELAELIAKVRAERLDQKLQEWADGYSLLLLYLKGDSPAQVLNELRLFSPKTLEMKILSLITEIWCRNKMREYSTMASLVSGLELSIAELDDPYIKESYSLRLKEALAFVNLYKFNNKELARKYANEIIFADFSATFTANASYLLGMSFLFDDYDECLGNILRHRELLSEAGRTAEIAIVDNNDIPFINNVWKKNTKQPETNDISEKAHYEAVKGNKELALKMIDEAMASGEESGFKYYYKGLATNDSSLFMQSLIYFVNRKGDKFFANLPYQFLKNDPIYKPSADMLMENYN